MKKPLYAMIQTDLSKVQSGDWFLPMTIKEVNQHAFIAEALSKGASGFTYEETQKDLLNFPMGTEHFAVPSLREYLFTLAQERRALIHPQIAVIAGSAGKTSVKELVGAILKSWHPDHSFISPENQNTKIALATQILRLPADCKSAAFEMGARRVNDFAIPLSYLQPSVVALLNIGTAHIGEFGSKENLRKEKLSCLNSDSATALVVPGDDLDILNYAIRTGKKILSFGYSKKSSVRILSKDSEQMTVSIQNKPATFLCPFQSSAKALNVAAAIAAATALGAPLSAIENGLKNFTGVPRRFQMFQWGSVTAIDDAFNASPESLQEGLQQLSKISKNKQVLIVLGSMLELGDSTEQEHRKIAHLIKDLFNLNSPSSIAIATVGQEAWLINQELQALGLTPERTRHFHTSSDALTLQAWRDEFDLIYFKGSKSVQLQKIFGV